MSPIREPEQPAEAPADAITRRDLIAGTMAISLTLAAQSRWVLADAAHGAGDQSARSLLEQRFRRPPAAYAPVDNWWWEAGRLEKEKLTWQLQELKDKGVGGTWFYVRWVHGESLSSDPHYWTPEWWDFTRYTLQEHERLGLSHWFSNWTNLQFQQDLVRKERPGNPALWGRSLVLYQKKSGEPIELAPEDELLEAAAYRESGVSIDYATRRVLTAEVRDRKLQWQAPGPGWVVTALVTKPWDLDYLNKAVGQRFGEAYLGEYEKHLPEFIGKTIKAFGADEMFVLNQDEAVTNLFSTELLARVKARRGYDLAPHLIALFHDIGPKTDQFRCDYYDAQSALLEESFYRPPSAWLESRGMQHATLSQLALEPLAQTLQYGDFYRFMRTYHVTGNEDPFQSKPGGRRLFGSKVSSSVAHLYERERVVLCGHYSTGWGQTQEQNLAWTNESYAKGLNLYCRHGAQYSLMGGWYEWVPPADHFHQPHWRYWGTFTEYVTRLSYILSQGKHRADVALFYPLTTLHANLVAGRRTDGFDAENPEEAAAKGPFQKAALEAARTTQDLTEATYHDGMDLDVVDNESLERATVRGGILEISGVEFRSIVLPALSTIRLACMQKVREFHDAGGTVVAFGRLPTATAENGRDDPQLRALIEAIFGSVPAGDVAVERVSSRGKAYFVPGDVKRVPPILSGAIVRAVSAPEKDLFLLHKKQGDVEVYFLFNVRQEARELPVRFRSRGRAEIWDASTGDVRPVYHWKEVGDELTELKVKMGPNEGVLVVFSPGERQPAVNEGDLTQLVTIETQGKLTIRGFDAVGGDKRLRVSHAGREYAAAARIPAPPAKITLPETFAFRIEPTMNNRWGDFRYPAAKDFIAAEARRFRYAEENGRAGTELGWHRADFKDSEWLETTYSHGPYWWHIGGFQAGATPSEFLKLAKRGKVEPSRLWSSGGKSFSWQRHHFSKKHGNAVHLQEGFLKLFGGLLGVPENFLVLDQPAPGNDTHYFFTHVRAPRAGEYVLHAGASPDRLFASQPQFTSRETPESAESWARPKSMLAWVNGAKAALDFGTANAAGRAKVRLRQGWNAVLLEVVRPDTGPVACYAVICESEPPQDEPYVPLLRWFRQPQPLVYDISPEKTAPVGWYRFKAPPGVKAMRLQVQGKSLQAWVDGERVAVADGGIALNAARAKGAQVSLRVEQERGTYAGAVFPEPVLFDCEAGQIRLGDWSDQGLATYSGIGVYSQQVSLEKMHLEGKVILDLGLARNVAEVLVNGKSAGVRLARPFRFDITDLVQSGPNALEIRVANTLANHMSTYPTQWVLEGQTVSGLLGPVELSFQSRVELAAVKV